MNHTPKAPTGSSGSRTFWRERLGPVVQVTVLRLPASVYDTLRSRRAAEAPEQSLQSYVADLVIRGLGLSPRDYRHETQDEQSSARRTRMQDIRSGPLAEALASDDDEVRSAAFRAAVFGLPYEAAASVSLDHDERARTLLIPDPPKPPDLPAQDPPDLSDYSPFGDPVQEDEA